MKLSAAVKPRIIYEISGKTVFVHAVLDARRNCEELLQQRILWA